MANNQKISNIISVKPSPDPAQSKAEQDYQNQINIGVFGVFGLVIVFSLLDQIINREKYKTIALRENNNKLSNWEHQLDQRFINLIENIFELVGVELVQNVNISNVEYKMIKARSESDRDDSKPVNYYLIAIPKTFFKKFNSNNSNSLELADRDVVNMRKAINKIRSNFQDNTLFIDHDHNERYLIRLLESSDRHTRKLIYIFPEIYDVNKSTRDTINVSTNEDDLLRLPQAILLKAGEDSLI